MKEFHYSILRFSTGPGRGEMVNLGVIVVSDHESESTARFLPGSRQKIFALAPGAPMEAIESEVERLRRRFDSSYQPTLYGETDPRISSTAELLLMSEILSSQLQLSQPRPYRASGIRQAANELYVDLIAPVGRPLKGSRGMTRSELRDLIRKTIKNWSSDINVRETEAADPHKAHHHADFWLESDQPGAPIAAFFAIPEDPAELGEARALRDSIPTIVAIFRKANPGFKAIAVLPTQVDLSSSFIQETSEFLGAHPGVVVTHVDKLSDVRELVLPAGLPA